MRRVAVIAAISFLATPGAAQSARESNELFVPTLGLSVGQASGNPLLGAFGTLGFQTRYWDVRLSGELAALPGACGDQSLSNCRTSNGAYWDAAVARRVATSLDHRSAWQVGMGLTYGPHRAWFGSPYAEGQAHLAYGVIARLGARYRFGFAGDTEWYGSKPPDIFSLYLSFGFANDGR